jgi:methionyl-tRNA formyltransferase
MSKTVILLGKGDLSVRIADWFQSSQQYDLIAVVPVMPEPSWTASLSTWARENGVRVVESGHYRHLAEDGPAIVADLGVSVFYDKIFKSEDISRFGKLINVHNGPLPKYRGMSPINWALKNNEVLHGVTIHEITPGIDDGPVISQVSYSIFPDLDEVEDVYKRALKFAWVLFEETMPLLDRIKPAEQDHSQATYYTSKDNHLLAERGNWRRELAAQASR